MNETAAKTRPFQAFRARRLALPAILILLVLAIAGCGSSSSSSSGNGVASKSADEIVAEAKKAASTATSVHVSGQIANEGKQIVINLHLVTGKGATGSLTLQGEKINIVETGSYFYLNAGESFYKQLGGTAAAQLLRGKWLKAPLSSGEFASLAGLTNLSKLLGSTLSAHGTLTKTGTTTVDGQAVVGVADTGKQGTLYVATTGSAYPVAIVKQGTSGGKISFDEWNKPVTITAPSPSVDLTQLQGG
jgi:hypothetical protein